MSMNKVIQLWNQHQDLFLYGIQITIWMAVIGTIVGFLIGLVLGGIQALNIYEEDAWYIKFIKGIGKGFVWLYVWFFRGTPMMVQAMLIYFGCKPILNWNALEAGMVIISINTGAYMAEIIRSGLQSIDQGQKEAGLSLGFSHFQIMRYILLPQCIKNTFPSIGNQLIVNLKDSSMLNVIGVVELFFQAKSIAGSTGIGSETYFLVACIYLGLTTIATLILMFLEKKLNTSKANGKYLSAV